MLSLINQYRRNVLPVTAPPYLFSRYNLTAFLMVLSVQFLGAQAVSADEPSDVPIFDTCTIGNETASIEANCTTITVPFTYENDNETLDVFVAKVSARQSPKLKDPLVLIAGGPGQSSTESFPALLRFFSDILETRDLLLIDQRGTGQSHRLDCDSAIQGEPMKIDHELVIENSKRCIAELDKDPRYFTTSIAVKDLEEIRKKLNIDTWNLYGVSYGTRVAMHYMRRYPQQVRASILDAVVPPDSSLGADAPVHAQQSMDAMYALCESNEDCSNQFPELRIQTQSLLERLSEKSIVVDFEDVSTGRMRQLEFSDDHVSLTLRLMTYSAYGVAILPSMLYDAYENENYAPLARQANMKSESLDSSIAAGMHNTVFCTEDPPSDVTTEQRDLAAKSYLSDTLLDAMVSNCQPWEKGVMDEDFKQPLISSIPTLILSGAADPITPASYGHRVAENLSNSVHIVNEHQGHMQIPLGCTGTLAARFINDANPSALNTECLDRLQPPAFFIDANGPKP